MPDQGAFQLNVETLGRLKDAKEFENIVVKTEPGGRVTRLRDIARVELGAQDYTANGYLDTRSAVPLLIFQQPGSNALATADRLFATMAELAKSFPSGLRYDVVYNPTEFIAQSVEAVIHTIYEAAILVVLVVILFLQTWRASIIPIVAIPISLIGTFAVMAAFGFSLNNLSLFGLVLAIGIVVDDAIVVVENVERNLEQGMAPKEAAHRTIDEVGRALVAIALVLGAVFIPAAFISGISGQFFRQFAVTIAAATAISCLVSLSLSPALCALLLKPRRAETGRRPLLAAPGARLLRRLQLAVRAAGARLRRPDRAAGAAGRGRARGLRRPDRAHRLAVPARAHGLHPAAGPGLSDHGDPAAARRPRSPGPMRSCAVPPRSRSTRRGSCTPCRSPASMAPPSPTRPTPARSSRRSHPSPSAPPRGSRSSMILADLSRRYAAIEEAFIIVVQPPPVRGIGTAGGFKMMVQDRRGRGLQALEAATGELVAAANQTPGLSRVFSLFNTGTPKIFADIDRVKAEMLGVTPEQVFEALEVYIGSTYVNDFNLLGRTFRVTAQADAPFRKELRDVEQLKTRSAAGAMVPLGSVATFRDISGPYRVPRYNLYPAAEVQGSTAPGTSTGEALAKMEQLAAQVLPDGFGYEWTELALQEKLAGGGTLLIFVASVVFVFLLLAAQYESWLAAAGGDPDRADVPARRGQRAARARHGRQHPGPDRLRRAGRAGRQERDPDRRVRAPGRGAGARPARGGDQGGAHAAAADPDDLLRLHLRRRAAGDRHRRGRRDAPVARHGGVLRHARRDPVRADLHAGLLRRLPGSRLAPRVAPARAAAGGIGVLGAGREARLTAGRRRA